MPSESQPGYGIDAPSVVLVFGVLGVVFVLVGIVLSLGQGAAALFGPWAAASLCFCALAYMIRSSRVAKPRIWRESLDALELRGDERALDAGCGRGLVAIELAKRLPDGEVVGADIWRSRDQTGNTLENATKNVVAEGVADRVEIVDGDLLDLPFGDAEFDVVTSSLAIHSLALAKDRGTAMHELMRVTKPGGRLLILDVGKTVEYQAWLRNAEWDDITRSGPNLSMYPAVRTVTATKPGRSTRAKRRS